MNEQRTKLTLVKKTRTNHLKNEHTIERNNLLINYAKSVMKPRVALFALNDNLQIKDFNGMQKTTTITPIAGEKLHILVNWYT